jgi:hypothetical protein
MQITLPPPAGSGQGSKLAAVKKPPGAAEAMASRSLTLDERATEDH